MLSPPPCWLAAVSTLAPTRTPCCAQATCPGGVHHATARALAWLHAMLLAWLLVPLIALAAWPLAHWRLWRHRTKQHVSRVAIASAPEAPLAIAPPAPAESATQPGHHSPGAGPGQGRTGRAAVHQRLGHEAPAAQLSHRSDGRGRAPEPETAVGRARVHARRTVTWAASTLTRPTTSCRTGHSAPLPAAATTAAPPVATAGPACRVAMPDGCTPAPSRDPLPYCGRTAWRSTRVKISGADPSQLRPGYAGRVAGVVAAAGLQVAGVYVRRGCIELTVDAVDMGPGQGQGQGHGLEQGQPPANVAASGSGPTVGDTAGRNRSTASGSAAAQPSVGTGLQPQPRSSACSGSSSSSSTSQGGTSSSHITTPQHARDGGEFDESGHGQLAAQRPARQSRNHQRPSAPEPPSQQLAEPDTCWELPGGDPGCLGGGEGAGGWESGSAWRGIPDGRLSGNGGGGSIASGSNASDGSLHGDARGSTFSSREGLSRPSGALPRVSLPASVGPHAADPNPPETSDSDAFAARSATWRAAGYQGRSSNDHALLDGDQGPLVESLLSSGAGSGSLYDLGGKGSGAGARGLGSGGGSVRALLGSVEVEALVDALQLPDFDLEGDLAAEDIDRGGEGSGEDSGVEVLSPASARPSGDGSRGSVGSAPPMQSDPSLGVNCGGMGADVRRQLSSQGSEQLSPSSPATEGDARGAFHAPGHAVLWPSLVALHPRVLWLGEGPESPVLSKPHLLQQQQQQQDPPLVEVTVRWEAVPQELDRARPDSAAPTADAAGPHASHTLPQGAALPAPATAAAAAAGAAEPAEPTPTRLSLRSQGHYAAFVVACPSEAALAADGADVTSWDAVYSVPMSALGPGLGPGVLLGEVLPGAVPDAGPAGAGPPHVASVPAALPVLLVDDPRVARELQTAVDSWNGDAAEVDALLLDVGALLRAQEDLAEALQAVTAAAATTASADSHGDGHASACMAALQAASDRLEGLYDHLQGYVQASGWYCTAAWLARRQERALGIEQGLGGQQQGPWEAGPRAPVDQGNSGGSRHVPGLEEDVCEELPTRGSKAEAAAAAVAAACEAMASNQERLSLALSTECSTADHVLGSCEEQEMADGSKPAAEHVSEAAPAPVPAGEAGPAALGGGALARVDTGEGVGGLDMGLTTEQLASGLAAGDVASSSFAPITPAYVRSSSDLEVAALLGTQAPHSGSHSGSHRGNSEVTVEEEDAEEGGLHTAVGPGAEAALGGRGVGEGSGGGNGTGAAGEAGTSSWAGGQDDAEGGEWLGMRRSVEEVLAGTQQQQQQAAGSRSSEEESCRTRRGGTALQGGQEEVSEAVLERGGCLETTGAGLGHLDAGEHAVAGSAATSSAAATLHAGSEGMAEEDGGRSGALLGRWRRPFGVDRNAPLLTWLWQMLQLVVGWRHESPEDAARYQAFLVPTRRVLASVMWVPVKGA